MENFLQILIQTILLGVVFWLFGFVSHFFKLITDKDYKEKIKREKEKERIMAEKSHVERNDVVDGKEKNNNKKKEYRWLKKIKKFLNKPTYLIRRLNLTIEERIITAIIIGNCFFLFIGYSLGVDFDFDYRRSQSEWKPVDEDYIKTEFNYIAGFSSFIISSGIAFLILKTKNNQNISK